MAYRVAAFRGGWFVPVLYVLVGAFVAAANHYFSHPGTLAGIVNALLGIFLWPLVLLGVHIHVS
jgi:hypothetical protein